jgi:membrane-associated protease RseP (regulator of RpoE activity)
VRRHFLLLAGVVGALAFLGWRVVATHAPSGVATTPADKPAAPAADTPAAPLAPATIPRQPQEKPLSNPREPAAVVVPADVVDAAEQRQFTKITRGMRSDPAGGVRVEEAPPGSVANQMHLQPGDLLKSVNNETVSSPEDFARIYRAEGIPGEFVVMRNGREMHRR